MASEKEIAKALLRIDAVRFCVEEPVTFVSGIKSPVYMDNRKLPFYPKEWRNLIGVFSREIEKQNIQFDVVAAVETSGIPHGSALAYLLQKPFVFVRKKPKEHGTKSRVEGGRVQGRQVLLIEDLVTTGQSSLDAVEALRAAGAEVKNCLIIVSYGFEEAKKAFAKAGVNLLALTSFKEILREAELAGKVSQKEKASVESWLKNPYVWGN